MEVEISDETQTVLDMTIGQTLLIGTVLEVLIENGVIDRAPLLQRLGDRRRSFGGLEEADGYAWPFQALEGALRIERADRASERAQSLRLVWSAEDGRCS